MGDLFLFGAGASFGSGAAVISYGLHAGTAARLPLGAGLFEELERKFPRWRELPEDAKAEFRRDGQFEPGFTYIRDRLDRLTPGLLRDMCIYFLQFKPGPDNLYVKISEIVARRAAQVVLATLNYDLLLECALSHVRGGFYYGLKPPEGVPSGCGVLKVHGSPNFLPQVPLTIGGPIFENCGVNVEARCYATGPAFAMKQLVEAEERDDALMVPALALYAPGKPVLYSPSHIRAVQAEFSEACAAAERIFLLGVRLVADDLHVWNPIAASPAHVLFVNPSQGDAHTFSAWAAENGVRHEWMRQTIEEFVAWLEPNYA